MALFTAIMRHMTYAETMTAENCHRECALAAYVGSFEIE